MAQKRNRVPSLTSRKRKAKETPKETAQEAAPQEVLIPIGEAQPVIEPPREATDAAAPATPTESAPVTPTEPPTPETQHATQELKPRPPRKSGRIALDINLGGEGHTWERVVTPDDQIVFRFKDDPSDAQHALIEKYGFGFNHEAKEAYRPNDATGRTYADKLAWFLKDLQRGEGQAEGRAAG